MRLALSAALIVTLAGPTFAAERIPNFPRQTDYDGARSSLMAIGWQPVAQNGKRCDVDGCFERCAPGFEQRCRAYPEAEICRGTGRASCEMIWKRGDTVIEVVTAGEVDPPSVASVKCRANCR